MKERANWLINQLLQRSVTEILILVRTVVVGSVNSESKGDTLSTCIRHSVECKIIWRRFVNEKVSTEKHVDTFDSDFFKLKRLQKRMTSLTFIFQVRTRSTYKHSIQNIKVLLFFRSVTYKSDDEISHLRGWSLIFDGSSNFRIKVFTETDVDKLRGKGEEDEEKKSSKTKSLTKTSNPKLNWKKKCCLIVWSFARSLIWLYVFCVTFLQTLEFSFTWLIDWSEVRRSAWR